MILVSLHPCTGVCTSEEAGTSSSFDRFTLEGIDLCRLVHPGVLGRPALSICRQVEFAVKFFSWAGLLPML